jgi:hypothetical protein
MKHAVLQLITLTFKTVMLNGMCYTSMEIISEASVGSSKSHSFVTHDSTPL